MSAHSVPLGTLVWLSIYHRGRNLLPVAPPTRVLRDQVTVGALVAGVLDVTGASPRRFFFQVLAHFATKPLEAERLAYFASSEGRDDLHKYNQRERVSLLPPVPVPARALRCTNDK